MVSRRDARCTKQTLKLLIDDGSSIFVCVSAAVTNRCDAAKFPSISISGKARPGETGEASNELALDPILKRECAFQKLRELRGKGTRNPREIRNSCSDEHPGGALSRYRVIAGQRGDAARREQVTPT